MGAPGGGGALEAFLPAWACCFALFLASNLLCAGGERLLLSPRRAPAAAGVLMPLLGCLPDALLVLFSGLGPDAQGRLSIGVGALAGSTVMLLTIPVAAVIFVGRVDLAVLPEEDKGAVRARPGPPGFDLLGAGVALGDEVGSGAQVLLLTLAGYALVEMCQLSAPAMDVHCSTRWALAACAAQLCCCLRASWAGALSPEGPAGDRIVGVTVQAIRDGRLSLRGALVALRERSRKVRKEDLEEELVRPELAAEAARLRRLLAPFYPETKDGRVDQADLGRLLADLNEKVPKGRQAALFAAADARREGRIGFEELAACCMAFAFDPSDDLLSPSQWEAWEASMAAGPEEQLREARTGALSLLAAGAALALAAASPAVGAFAELGRQLGVPPFFVAFALAPAATNAGELVAAVGRGRMRTAWAATTSLGELQAAAALRNTVCLGVLLAVVHVRRLAWAFSAELLPAVALELALGLWLLRRDRLTLLEGLVILSLCPLYLAAVCALSPALRGV